jgi:predicted Zn finger-like uncharacterized protein
MAYQPQSGGKHVEQTPSAPTACPACRSTKVVTTSKVAALDSYWRCMGCGEVWNVSRREPPGRRRYEPFR